MIAARTFNKQSIEHLVTAIEVPCEAPILARMFRARVRYRYLRR